MRLTSMKIHYVLAALLSLWGVACDGGGDEGDGTAGSGNVGNTPGAGAGGGGAGVSNGGSGGGSAGAPPVGSTTVISDFETPGDGGVFDGYSENAGFGWKVAWFTYTDTGDGKSAGATITPAEMMRFVAVEDPARAPGTHVGNAKGGGFKSWGAGMGFNFVSEPAPALPGSVDISTFKGISFWIKANDVTTGTVQVKIVDKQNTPTARGGTCAAVEPMRCDDVFVTSVVAKAEWTQVTRLWSDFKQGGWGMLPFPAPELGGVIGIQFQVGTVATFDYSVDDVALVAQ